MTTYRGSCHCGAITFRLRSDAITTGVRCNCSMCARKGAVMSSRYFSPEEFEALDGIESLAVYRWGDRMVNHYFCRTCGVYPFHDATTKPGHYRINLGCVDGLDPLTLAIELIDGKSF
jgi:hypothetical protein